MPGPDYIPANDEALRSFAANFEGIFSAQAVALGFTAADATALDDQITVFSNALTAWGTKQAAAKGARSAKDDARAGLVAMLRNYTQRIRVSPAATDALIQELGLPVYDTIVSHTPVPNARPLLVIDTGERLRHTVHFYESATKKAKPAGAVACEIWVSIGAAPQTDGAGNPLNMTFLAVDTAEPYLAVYASEHAGKAAYYAARWAGSSEDERGPWSEIVVATIGG